MHIHSSCFTRVWMQRVCYNVISVTVVKKIHTCNERGSYSYVIFHTSSPGKSGRVYGQAWCNKWQSALASSSSSDLSTPAETEPCPGMWNCSDQLRPFELRSQLTATLLFRCSTIADQWDLLTEALSSTHSLYASIGFKEGRQMKLDMIQISHEKAGY